MNWDNLRFYLEVARQGTVSAAASSLQVSHATVLRRIEQCEGELGVKLFKHLQSGYVLSSAGEQILSRVEQLESITLGLQRDFSGQDEALAGRLRVTQPGNGIIDLYPLYAAFNKLYPQIQLDIIPSAEVRDLNRHEADVAIRFTNEPHDLLVGHCLGDIDFYPYASTDYLKGPVKQGVEDYDWIVWRPENRELKASFQYDWLLQHCQNPTVVMQTSSVSDIISAVRAGIGVGLLSETIVKKYYPEFQPVLTSRVQSGKKLWVLAHRDLRQLARVKVFMRFIYDAFNQ